MAIDAVCVAGYRSIRHAFLPLHRINVVVGANATGKSNLYNALQILQQAANGSLASAIANEGGMASILWAGARHKGPVRMCIAARFGDYSYHLECGLPPPSKSLFGLDPAVREENIFLHTGSKRVQLVGRSNASTWVRDATGRRAEYPVEIRSSESILGEVREPDRFPVLFAIRRELLSWRFYHHFRTDADSPLRQPQVGTYTPVLARDGRDLAAAIGTITEVGDWPRFMTLLNHAFPGATIEISPTPKLELTMRFPGLFRDFAATELSDGTLQYLCLLTALLSPRPPEVIALNEPESSMHADLLEPLAKLIADAATRTQLWITTHSPKLAEMVQAESKSEPIQIEKVDGETRIVGQSALERAMTI